VAGPVRTWVASIGDNGRLRAELDKLKDETTKLKDALKKVTDAAIKAAKAAAKAAGTDDSGDSSDDSSDDSSTSTTPNWGALSQWMSATAPGASPEAADPANGGSWQGNPGPLGVWGARGQQGGPRPMGRFNGMPGVGQGGDQTAFYLSRMTDNLEQLVSETRQLPAKNAAGMAAAMNGVSGTAIMRGHW
jgi:hypothetical protein